MPRKLRDLRADLQRAGFYRDHRSESHQVWKHELLSGISANLAGKDSAGARPYQEREVQEAPRRLREAQDWQRRHPS